MLQFTPTIIRVKSKAESFWRAGIQFTRAGVEIDPAALTAKVHGAHRVQVSDTLTATLTGEHTVQLTAEQLDAIRTDPNLLVTEVTPVDEQAHTTPESDRASVGGGKDAATTPGAPKRTPAGNAKQPGAAKGKGK